MSRVVNLISSYSYIILIFCFWKTNEECKWKPWFCLLSFFCKLGTGSINDFRWLCLMSVPVKIMEWILLKEILRYMPGHLWFYDSMIQSKGRGTTKPFSNITFSLQQPWQQSVLRHCSSTDGGNSCPQSQESCLYSRKSLKLCKL